MKKSSFKKSFNIKKRNNLSSSRKNRGLKKFSKDNSKSDSRLSLKKNTDSIKFNKNSSKNSSKQNTRRFNKDSSGSDLKSSFRKGASSKRFDSSRRFDKNNSKDSFRKDKKDSLKSFNKNDSFKNNKKISNKQRTKNDRKKYFNKSDSNYLSKRFKRNFQDDISHKPKSPLIRLNKFLYEKNICSRREADVFIKQGLIFVNNKKAIIGQKINPIKDKIKISDIVKKELKNKIVVALNKPKGFVSENPTKNEREASSLLPFTEKLSAVGRLDKNSTGLLLLTNDGKIVNKLLNPKFNHEKEYIVEVDKKISPIFLKKMKEGVDIGGYITKRAKIKKLTDKTFKLTLTEGKNHQIKKMTNKLGYTVRNLKRTKFNTISLKNLAVGKYRVIEGKEYLKLMGKF